MFSQLRCPANHSHKWSCLFVVDSDGKTGDAELTMPSSRTRGACIRQLATVQLLLVMN